MKRTGKPSGGPNIYLRAIPILLGLVLVLFTTTGTAQTNPAVRSFIIFSDLHYDGSDLAGTNLSALGEDANGCLIHSALTNAAAQCPDPLFVLCSGDVVSHHLKPETKVDWIQRGMARAFQTTFAPTPVFTSLGNNDAYVDYVLQATNFLTKFSSAWRPLLAGTPAAAADFAATFPAKGWYAADAPGVKNLRLVALNSAYFEANPLHPPLLLAQEQFDWLARELAQAQQMGKKCWLLFHIPPGKEAHGGKGKPMWNDFSASRFLRLVGDYHRQIGAIFCGHTHMDEFRLLYLTPEAPLAFIHITPSVGANHFNHPAYQIFQVDTNTAELADYATWSLNLSAHSQEPNQATWSQEYSFDAAYHCPAYSLASLTELARQLAAGNKSDSAQHYLQFYDASGANQFDAELKADPEKWAGYVRALEVRGN